jgi:hypothetical protein
MECEARWRAGDGMPNSILSDQEIRLVKGLITHKQLNDQQTLSIFSYLHRNFNHRIISAIRNGSTARYQNAPTATIAEVDALLYQYAKITALADLLGFGEVDEVSKQVYKSSEIMKAAIAIYNNNMMVSRSETFIVLAVIAWTYALHSYFRKNSIEPVYLDPNGTVVVVDGRPKLWELSACLNKVDGALTEGEKRNIRYLIAIRNEVEHRSCEDINEGVQSKLQANVLNFLKFVKTKFGNKFDFSQDLAFAIQLQALTLKSPSLSKNNGIAAKSVAAVNAALEEQLSPDEYNDPDYAFRVYVVPKVTNNSKKMDQAVSYNPVGSDVEIAIKHVERPKFRQSDAITALLADGVPVSTYTFQKAWKKHDLKAPGRGFAIELGNQWFWYQEGIDAIKAILVG